MSVGKKRGQKPEQGDPPPEVDLRAIMLNAARYEHGPPTPPSKGESWHEFDDDLDD